MSYVKIEGNASGTGTFTIAAPNTNTDRTLTLPDEAGTVLTSASDLPAANLTGTLPAGVGFTDKASNDLDITGVSSYTVTGIPANATMIVVNFRDISGTGSAELEVQLGTSSGLKTSGYATSNAYYGLTSNATASSTNCFGSYGFSGSAQSRTGRMVITRTSDTSKRYVVTTIGMSTADPSYIYNAVCRVLLGDDLDRICFYLGTGTFDDGVLNVSWI
jgi:hypothetical protein